MHSEVMTTHIAFHPETDLETMVGQDIPLDDLRAWLEEKAQEPIAERQVDPGLLLEGARMMAEDKTLAEIAEKLGLEIEEAKAEFDSFGTWLGQRDASLAQAPVEGIYIPDDMRGSERVKRNIVTALARGDITSDLLLDYLDQRYAVGDLNFVRRDLAYFSLLAKSKRLIDVRAHVDGSIEMGFGRPAVIWLQAIDMIKTAYEDLERGLGKIVAGIEIGDWGDVAEGAALIAWVNPAASRNTRRMAEQAASGNQVAIKRAEREASILVSDARELLEGGVDEFAGRIGNDALPRLWAHYKGSHEQDDHNLESEAREWLRERGLARSARSLLEHVTWAMTNGELPLLEAALNERAEGNPDWEAILIEAKRAGHSA